MDEQERKRIVQEVAQQLARAGLGWHEDAIERLTRPPIEAMMTAAEAFKIIGEPAIPKRPKRKQARSRRSSDG